MHLAIVYTPAAASTTGYATAQTGATWTLAATTAADSLAHLTTITNNSATDLSSKTALITGTDADGLPQTETLTLPGASVAVTGLKYFKTVTSIVPSATIGAPTVGLGWAATAVGPTVELNWRQNQFQVSIGLWITGTISVTEQHSFDYLRDSNTVGPNLGSQNANWWNDTYLTAVTASTESNYILPPVLTRLKINSVTATATVTQYIIQGDKS